MRAWIPGSNTRRGWQLSLNFAAEISFGAKAGSGCFKPSEMRWWVLSKSLDSEPD